MKFKINGQNWTIKELSQKEIRENSQCHGEDFQGKGRYFGVCWHDTQEIFIDKDLHQERKRKTLIHELTHCYIASFIKHSESNYDEEEVADIVSNSHNIITPIINRYFKVVN